MRPGFLSATILALLASAATADVTLRVIDATPTARNDGTLPGIGETIFSADVFVDVTPDDNWFSGAVTNVGQTPPASGVALYFSSDVDPNTGASEPVMTAPGFGSDALEFSTFVSLPSPRSERSRFTIPADISSGFPAPKPDLTPDHIEIAYLEFPPSRTLGSGFTQRVTIDIGGSGYEGSPVYVSASGPRSTDDILLAGFRSFVTGLSSPAGDDVVWGFYAVPEPASVMLVLCLALVLPRYRSGNAGN